ncbi:hypothetical protein C8F04DRAFT_1264312 [Mycena alexandri]|uniref:Uncharacterized protein n=1 Tax=Mycena alexandri TaxID=1745969 RepID=A0AAD6WZ64_9AGAR|nr:hypothetical protein C8F04DRAFT_1264312 [Mycena alexandri]
MIPSSIENLRTPPPEFVLCYVNDHLGRNFTNHDDFSQKVNKTYWLMLLPAEDTKSGRDGVYSLKTDILQRKPYHYDEDRVVGSVAEWKDVLPVKHPDACRRGTCPRHPREAGGRLDSPRRGADTDDVKPRVKREMEDDEEAGRPRSRRVKLDASPQRSASDSESEDSDINEPEAHGGIHINPNSLANSVTHADATSIARANPSSLPSANPSSLPRADPSSLLRANPNSLARPTPAPSLPAVVHTPAPMSAAAPALHEPKGPPHVRIAATHAPLWVSSASKLRGVSAPATSSTVSSTSSLSASTATSGVSKAAPVGKGKGRAAPLGGADAAHASGSGSGSLSGVAQAMGAIEL